VSYFGKILILLGFLFIIIGIILAFIGRIPFIGKLPGDIYLQRKNFTIYFPLTTSILISIILTLLFSIFFRGK